jgi:hypothetical protein
MTEKVLRCFEARTFHGSSIGDAALQGTAAEATLDVGARLKEMW